MIRSALEFLVVGDPIEHSRSPIIHQAALDWNGIAGRYGRRRVTDEAGMAQVASDLRSGELAGVNVTMPHKSTASALADHRSEAAARTDSVNTLAMRDGHLFGDTTDVAGIRWAWQAAGFEPNAPVHILGAGGAAAAALLAFENHPTTISSRRPHAALALVERVGVDAEVIPWGSGTEAVLVNATPIGMTTDTGFPLGLLDSMRGVFDMVYGHETEAVAEARSRGLPAIDGTLMLVGQAAASFTLWTGVASPHAVMLAALGHRQT